MTDALTALRRADVLSALDAQAARTLARLAGEGDARVVLALALVSRHARLGHVCLELAQLEARGVRAELAGVLGCDPLPPLAELRAALAASRLVGTAPDEHAARPLFLDARDRLYLRRLYDQERAVAAAVLALAASPAERVSEAVLARGLERLFGVAPHKPAAPAKPAKRAAQEQLDLFGAPPKPATPAAPAAPPGEPDAQRAAAEHAVRRRFSVVSGGPGTGKTFTVVKMLALLVEQALAHEQRAPTTLLLAPTGKAAARLSESVRNAKAKLGCDPDVIAAIPDEASTLHRALGVRRNPREGSSHGPREPLAADVIVVDEASMVDLGMMERLLGAVPERARLVLLGDRDQLASVEAGAVLGDICGDGSGDGSGNSSDDPRPLARSITVLTRSHRFAEDSAIKQLAEAIRRGDVARALEVLRSGRGDAVLREPAQGIDPALLEAAAQRFSPLFEGDATARLAALDRFRVLCAHRTGPFGVGELNQRVEQALRRSGALRTHDAVYAGRPILITENSYEGRLWNGDLGVVVEQPGGGLRACFADPKAPGGVRGLPLARLPAHESVYAMSVHKSQGSEVDEVAVVLPAADSPLLSRELLYTAVTRARERVVIYATAEALKACVERRVARASGLREALWGA